MRTSSLLNLFGLALASSASAQSFNLSEGVTPLSHDMYDLHMLIFWICVGIGIIVFGAIFYAIIFHRQGNGRKKLEIHTHLGVELTWTIVPFLILILMAIPATKVLIAMNNTEKEDLTVLITGYQWKWKYDYLNQKVQFFSNSNTPYAELHNQKPKNPDYLRQVDHPLVLPIHEKIRLLMTSNDVIHSWWVPELGVKRDALPGIVNEAWVRIERPGIYYGQCTELCGLNHAYMTIVVVAKSQNDFKEWLAEQRGEKPKTAVSIVTPPAAPGAAAPKAASMQDAIKQGEQIYQTTCSVCHQPDGKGQPPTYPALAGSPIVTGPLDQHLNRVLNGKPGTAMQAFKDQFDDESLAAVITYERNSFGNQTGTWVKAADVKQAREKFK